MSIGDCLDKLFPNRVRCGRQKLRAKKQRYSRVPEVTIFFWFIKCLATALGETMADQMTTLLGDDEGKALAVYGCLLFFFLCIQFALRQYFAPIYWICIILLSITGTLITDIMVDNDNV